MVVERHLIGFSQLALGERLQLARQLDIEVADAADGMRDQVNDHLVVNVGPLRVVAHRLGQQSRAGHEPEGVHEVLKLIFAVELAAYYVPAGEFLQAGLQICIRHLARLFRHGASRVDEPARDD